MYILILPKGIFCVNRGAILLTWINFNPNMDKQSHAQKVWAEIMYLFPNLYHWSLGMDK